MVLPIFCFVLAKYFENMGTDAEPLWDLGILTYLLCIPLFFIGRYTEGKGKRILLGGKLVQKELKPAEFIKRYESLKNSDNLVILVAHYQLGEICEKLDYNEKAVSHYQYCVNNGGETAIKKSAFEKIQYINKENLGF